MGALLSIPLLTGGIASLGSTIFSGCMVFMGELIRHMRPDSPRESMPRS